MIERVEKMKVIIIIVMIIVIVSMWACLRISGSISREEENEYVDIDHDESGLIEED